MIPSIVININPDGSLSPGVMNLAITSATNPMMMVQMMLIRLSLAACLMTEILATFFFLFIIIGTTSRGAATGFAGIPIGLALTLIHLITIPVTNTSVNPARSTGPALFAGTAYIGQLWLFWVAPIVGAVIAGL